jgi:preprotein translocase subunit SecD
VRGGTGAVIILIAATAVAAADPLPLTVVNGTVTNVLIGRDLGGTPGLSLTLSPESAAAFGDFTAANIGKTVVIRIDGKPVLSAVVREPIYGGRVRISGADFSFAELRAIANRIDLNTVKVEAEVVPP